PLSGLTVTIPRATLARLAGDDAERALELPEARLELAPARLDDLVLDPVTRGRLYAWAMRLTPLVVTGPRGVGRTTAARAAFAAAELPTVTVTLDGADDLASRVLAARREARWSGAGLVIRIPEAWRPRDSTMLWSTLAGVAAPIAIVATAEHAESLAVHAPLEPMTVALGRPDLVQRARLWQALVPDGVLSPGDRDELAARYEFSASAISRTIRRAAVDRLGKDELHAAARAIGSANISTIAQPLPLVYTREDLVLPPRMLGELDLAIAWIRYKRHIYDTWGFGRRIALGRGLTALFAGPPGTGKTMTAQVLARELGLDLYRVDLSRVMSKYIGETEKNLSRLFDEAQASGAALLFDEADALFGKRSESRDAHDRYANIEIGYLLQRMEEHEGVAILATNRVGDLDEAFLRRFHFLLDFPMPDASYRLRLWHGMLPREVERAPDLDLGPLAATYELSGGEIRNCVLAAAYMAAAEGTCVRFDHLERGLRRELGKTGRIVVAPRRRTIEEEV
ncbi:MAG TPA: AAA family ATPase, partial [Kofleriaceae bacterium]